MARLSEEEERILAYLEEERRRNPETSVVGVPDKAIGANVGALFNHVRPQLRGLQQRDFLRPVDDRVVLTHKGIEYVSKHKLQFVRHDDQKATLSVWIRDHISVALATSIIGSIIGGLVIVFIFR